MAEEAAKAIASAEPGSLAEMLQNALRLAKESEFSGYSGLDPPHIASAFVAVGNASVRHSRVVRAKLAAWRDRIARGLLVDHFGKDASDLRQRILAFFDTETLEAVGLPLVGPYRLELRTQLEQLIDGGIRELFQGLVKNLEKASLRRFNTALLKTVNSKEAVESVLDINAAALRKESLLFETVMEDLEVPILGLTREKASREVSSKLNDALDTFPDSPLANLKRSQQIKTVVSKEKKPGQRAIGFGLDLVAMLRPDGFGSLQGYAGYQLSGGNSITFGVHNDADDPQVIAQFGGVRPPFLRVQPKLRIDAEL